ncbi:MLX-interacting protein isoform X2 [Anthonomus grandis grandis]|uniref:MLX-interacting protein isoform X2 n=1 Tax=Anthonomus grandis grandis TaxID=2921223 RepID=UPI00216586D2|nr:MLX-interacting protein isoform X2 [Anthonomus grandis grandis]
MSSYLVQHKALEKPVGKESIHSGQFMVSQFEAEEQDDEDNVAVPIPEVIEDSKVIVPVQVYIRENVDSSNNRKTQQQLFIDQSLAKLFQCMSLAYRQKLTSPKWNRFRGIRLRWKDKIRLNNVIWRCWHLQFIKKEQTLICQFASPLDVDTHNKPEAIVLEGKYWKRKLAAVTAEYKKWRMFYRNHLYGHTPKEDIDMLNDVDAILGDSNSMDNMNMMIDEDYMGLMSDTLFSTITNQPFAFPDTRELAKSGFADYIQPSLGPLQPNLDDYMDTFEQEFYANTKLATVPEEQPTNPIPGTWDYQQTITAPDLTGQIKISPLSNYHLQNIPVQEPTAPPSYSSVILDSYVPYIKPKIAPKTVSRGKIPQNSYDKCIDIYQQNYATVEQVVLNDRLQTEPDKTAPAMLTTNVGSYTVPITKGLKVEDQNSQMRRAISGPAYKYPTAAPQTGATNLKFNSQQYQPGFSQVKETKQETTSRGRPPSIRASTRGRSRSNTREPMKRPILVSAASDTALISPQTNVLLTQLLTTSSPLSEAVHQAYASNQSSMGSAPDLRRVKEENVGATGFPPPPPPPPIAMLTMSSPSHITVSTNSADSAFFNSNSNSPSLDSPVSQNLHSPTSSQGSVPGSPGRGEGGSRSGGDRRVGHIHAEQKRRCNIKNGFDMIHSLIPQLSQNPNTKLSKAAMLQKGAEYIRTLRHERAQIREEMDSLRQQIESLNTSISNCQSMLPATGAPVSRRRDSRMQEMFDEYVRSRTMENWKFWIFSLICRPLLNSFNNFVSTSSLDDLYTSTLLWIEQHCTLVDLRPVVLNSLRYLCTKTEILSEPEKLPEEAKMLVLSSDKKK